MADPQRFGETWEGGASQSQAGAQGHQGYQGRQGNQGVQGPPSTYSTTIGDGVATSFSIPRATHGLAANSTNTVAVYVASSGLQVTPLTVTVHPSTGDVTITFTSAPTTNQYRVVIK